MLPLALLALLVPAQAATTPPEALERAAPLALVVEGVGDADGRYLLQGGPAVAADACYVEDGVFWEHEQDPRFVIQGQRDHGEWYIVDQHGDWSFAADVRGCDPGADLEWTANPGRVAFAPAAGTSPSVTSQWRTACFFEVVPGDDDATTWTDAYSLCDSPAGLFGHRLLTDEWVPGLCNVTDDSTAIACLETWCSGDIPLGDQDCSSVEARDESGSNGGGDDDYLEDFLDNVVPAVTFCILIIFFSICCSPSRIRRSDKIQPKETAPPAALRPARAPHASGATVV